MIRSSHERLARVAAILTLVALALMVWSVLDPRPLSTVAAMTVGQVIGTTSLVLFLVVVFVRRRP